MGVKNLVGIFNTNADSYANENWDNEGGQVDPMQPQEIVYSDGDFGIRNNIKKQIMPYTLLIVSQLAIASILAMWRRKQNE